MNNKRIGVLFCLLFLFSFLIPLIGLNPSEIQYININPKTSANYLYNNKSYDFFLNDFYDSDDLTKTYTGAEFQTEDFDGNDWSGTIDKDTIPNVDNTKTQYGDPSNINMLKGTTDSVDNMKVNDLAYTTFTSAFYSGGGGGGTTFYESPQQWADFDFTGESGGVIGELETNDGDYARINPKANPYSESYLGYIVPENDILTNWNEGDAAPHWSKLDEAKGDMDGDLGNIRETNSNVDDKWGFTSLIIPAGRVVSKLVICVYIKKQSATQNTYLLMNIIYIGYENVVPTINYTWISCSYSGLSLSQANLDGIWMNVEPRWTGGEQGWIDIETIYIDVYTSKFYYNFDYIIIWDVTDPDLVSIDTFYYDYRITAIPNCKLYIYNWDTTNWLMLESNSVNTYITGSYDLTDPYISGTDQVRIRFVAANSISYYDMELDQIVLEYSGVDVGVDTREIEMTIRFPSIRYDDILAMTIQSWQRTNISQIIDFSICNHDTGVYVQISSSSDNNTFTEKEYITSSPEKFISSNEVVILHWVGINTTSGFELHIDYLFIRIYYKLNLVHTKTFDTDGIYRYRWLVLSSDDYTQWVEFEVIPKPSPPSTEIWQQLVILLCILFIISIIIFIYLLRRKTKKRKVKNRRKSANKNRKSSTMDRFKKKLMRNFWD